MRMLCKTVRRPGFRIAGFHTRDQLPCIYFNQNKRKSLHNNKTQGFVRDTIMAAISLFRGTNMAAVTSCETQELSKIDKNCKSRV